MLPRSTVIALLVGVAAVSTALIAPVGSHSAGPTFFSTTAIFSNSCPYGWKLTGGGVGSLPRNSYSSSSSTEYALTGSYPSASGWNATATVTRGYYSTSSGWRFSTSSYPPRVYTICAK